MSDYSPDAKIYSAENGLYSMYDLLSCFADPEMEVDGMPRISDLHMKVGEPVRFRCDGELETQHCGCQYD